MQVLFEMTGEIFSTTFLRFFLGRGNNSSKSEDDIYIKAQIVFLKLSVPGSEK